MIRLFQFFVMLLAVLLTGGHASAQTRNADLINRLGFYSSKQCILSVEALKKEFPSAYTPPSTWKTTLDELDGKSKLIIKRLQSADTQAIADGEALIRAVDAIFLENPLIKGKKIASVRRELGAKARNATGGTLGVVRVWDFASQKVVAEAKGHSGSVSCAAFSPDGKQIVSTGTDGMTMIWNLFMN